MVGQLSEGVFEILFNVSAVHYRNGAQLREDGPTAELYTKLLCTFFDKAQSISCFIQVIRQRQYLGSANEAAMVAFFREIGRGKGLAVVYVTEGVDVRGWGGA